MIGARLRAGASQRGVVHFAKETVGRIRRVGARGPLSVRADSGFWSYPMLAALDRLGVGWSITSQLNAKVRALISNIGEDCWVPIAYTRGGEAQVGETVLEMTNPQKRSQKRLVRLVVRRSGLVGSQAPLWPDWRYHAFVTNLDLEAVEADQHHQPRHGQDDPHTNPGTDKTPRPLIETARRTARCPQSLRTAHRRHATCESPSAPQDSGGLRPTLRPFRCQAAWAALRRPAHNSTGT